jgi:uncharacterized OB-fold protein
LSDTQQQAIRLVTEQGFRDGVEPRLVISECADCTSRWFPPLERCSACASTNLTDVISGRDGVAYASTVVRVGPPGFTAPYVLSYVDIDGIRLLAHTDGDTTLAPGSPVRITSGPIGRDGEVTLHSYRVRAIDPSETTNRIETAAAR